MTRPIYRPFSLYGERPNYPKAPVKRPPPTPYEELCAAIAGIRAPIETQVTVFVERPKDEEINESVILQMALHIGLEAIGIALKQQGKPEE